MSSLTRTFVALAMPNEVEEELVLLQNRLAPAAPGIRWVVRESTGFHLTLAFLGDVPDARLDPIGTVVEVVAARFGPLDLRVAGLGAFPSPSRPRVVWAGLEGPGIGALEALQAATAAALAAIGHGPPDDRFTPHITIGRAQARRGRPPDLREPLAWFEDHRGPDFRITKMTVFASRPGPQGPVYTPRTDAPLRG